MLEEYRRRMGEAGPRCDLHWYEGQAHGFFSYGDGTCEHYYTTTAEADRFLASLGYTAGAPQLQWPGP
jgi:hypothetical protein